MKLLHDSTKLIIIGAFKMFQRPARQRAETIAEQLYRYCDTTVVLAELTPTAFADLDALLNELLAVTHEDLPVWWG